MPDTSRRGLFGWLAGLAALPLVGAKAAPLTVDGALGLWRRYYGAEYIVTYEEMRDDLYAQVAARARRIMCANVLCGENIIVTDPGGVEVYNGR